MWWHAGGQQNAGMVHQEHECGSAVPVQPGGLEAGLTRCSSSEQAARGLGLHGGRSHGAPAACSKGPGKYGVTSQLPTVMADVTSLGR